MLSWVALANVDVEQDKAAARKEKEERKAAKRAEKDAEKARKSEDKRKSREQNREQLAAVAGGAALGDIVDKHQEEEQQQQKDQETAGEGLAGAIEKSKEEDKKDELDRMATGATLAEVAERVQSNQSEEQRTVSRDTETDAIMDSTAVAPLAAAGASPIKEPAESKEEAKEEPREVAREPTKDKPQRRSMFGSISDRFKRKNREDKTTAEPKKSIEEEEKHDDGAAVPVVGLTAAGLAATAGGEEEHPSPTEEKRDVDDVAAKQDDDAVAPTTGQEPATRDVEEQTEQKDDESDDGIDRVQMASAIAGTAALGSVVAAGSVAREQRRESGPVDTVDREDHIETSSVSTESEELSDSDDERDLQGAVTATEHDGSYNFAAASPTVQRSRPDIERHISTIQDSSDSEPEESWEATDEDDEPQRGRLEPRPTMVGDFQDRPSPLAENKPMVINETVPESALEERDSPVSPLQQPADPAADGKVVDVQKEAAPEAPQATPKPDDSVSVAESGAPAPVVKSGPGDEQRKLRKEKDEDKEKKEGGVRGFFRKLKNKSKQDNKLQKRQPSATPSESSATAAASKDTEEVKAPEPLPVEGSKAEEYITPVTSTSAAAEQEQHMGTDGPIGDPKKVSGIGGDPRPTSPSSFERHGAQPRDLDDVSSSGAEEEDVSRGRTGRLARKLGLKKDDQEKGQAKGDEVPQSTTTRTSNLTGESDQFEEARDQFDESLAPPPAFGGQMKSESPVRETRFQEQL